MEARRFPVKRPSEIRKISRLGNNAIIALELASNGKPQKELLTNGIEFCDLLLEGIEPGSLSVSSSVFPSHSKFSILKNEKYLKFLIEVDITLENFEEKIKDLKTFFCSLISEETEIEKGQAKKCEKIIKKLSNIFYMADVVNLRQAKEKGGSKAYG